MNTELITQEVLTALLQQVIFYAIISSVFVDGIKKTIKAAKKQTEEDKLSPYVGLALTYGFGLLTCFFLKSPMLTSVFIKLFFGIIIGAVGVAVYEAVIKSVITIIPNITKKIFGDKS
jgi:uncharacterized protein YacL